ncbi:MAG: hypothetical protein LBU27_06095 [Candidatus Peribacteria bacterium]|nr:hypothetical protein [Candidatus Peribacteria bacterium]
MVVASDPNSISKYICCCFVFNFQNAFSSCCIVLTIQTKFPLVSYNFNHNLEIAVLVSLDGLANHAIAVLSVLVDILPDNQAFDNKPIVAAVSSILIPRS